MTARFALYGAIAADYARITRFYWYGLDHDINNFNYSS